MTVTQGGPDPAGVRTPEEFVELLRHIRGESGLSFWDIQRRAHDHGYDLEPAVVVNALGQAALPDWQIVVGLLTACGLRGMQIDRWMRVYHDLAAAEPDPAVRPAQGQLAGEPAPVAGGHRRQTRRLTYRQGLYLAATAAVAILALLVTTMWSDEPDPAAAPTPGAPAPGSAQTAPSSGPPQPSAAPPARTTTITATPPPAGAEAGVLRSGTVTLADGQGVDLDTGQSGVGLDIVAPSATALATGDHVKRLMRMPSTPSRQTCASLKPGQLERDVTGLAAGQWLCVRTSTGRWARVNVVGTDAGLKLDYTVWT